MGAGSNAKENAERDAAGCAICGAGRATLLTVLILAFLVSSFVFQPIQPASAAETGKGDGIMDGAAMSGRSHETMKKAALSCSITVKLQEVRLDWFPLTFMANETAAISAKISDGKTPVKSGNCSVSILDSRKVATILNAKASLQDDEFVLRTKLSDEGSPGQWSAVVMWSDGALSVVNTTYFNVAKPSLGIRNFRYSPSLETIGFSCNVLDASMNLIDYDVLAMILKNGVMPPRTSTPPNFLYGGSFNLFWSVSPSPFVYPGSTIDINACLQSSASYEQNLNVNATLRDPLSVWIDPTTIKKSSLAVSSSAVSVRLKPHESVRFGMQVQVPSLHDSGARAVFPLRLSSKTIVSMEVSGGANRATGTAKVQVLPKELAGYTIVSWTNLTPNTRGDYSASMKMSGSNFTVFLMAAKASGESAALFRPISLVRPIVTNFNAKFNGTDVLLNATSKATNKVVFALFQYSADGKAWKNITMDTDQSNGWDGLWNVSDLLPGRYYLRVRVVDEFGFDNAMEISVNIIRTEPENPTKWLIAGIMLLFISATILLFAVQSLRILRGRRSEIAALDGVRSLLKAEAYRSVLTESFAFFLALNRKYEKLEFQPNWNINNFKRVLRARGVMTPAVGSFIMDYHETRFSTHEVGRSRARNALRTVGQYRQLVHKRVEERKVRGEE